MTATATDSLMDEVLSELKLLVADEFQKRFDAFASSIDDRIKAMPKPRDGLDALDIVIRHGIDVDKTYPRGTYASYKGGLVVSFRETDPLSTADELANCGWQVLLNGIADEEETVIDGGRFIRRRTVFTNGWIVTRDHQTAATVYRKMYRTNVVYQAGDTCTYGGSTWHCNATTSASPGNLTSDWTLMVRRGRDSSGSRGAV